MPTFLMCSLSHARPIRVCDLAITLERGTTRLNASKQLPTAICDTTDLPHMSCPSSASTRDNNRTQLRALPSYLLYWQCFRAISPP